MKPENVPRRQWCFTINNPTSADVDDLTTLTTKCVYLVYAKEHYGERPPERPPSKSWTPHFQGYVEYKTNQRFTALKKILRRANISSKYDTSTRTQAKDYCFKDAGTAQSEFSQPTEFGTFLPDQAGARNDLLTIKRKIDDSVNERDIASNEQHFGSWCRYRASFARYRVLKRKRQPITRHVEWWYGPPGCSKTWTADDTYPDAYIKDSCSRWWDGYIDEPEVIFDDFRPEAITFKRLLRLLDNYEVRVECKGGSEVFAATTIIITSPFTPQEMFANSDENLQQLLRRINVIKHFNVPFVTE